MLILGIDPGSAHCGIALLSTADASQPGAPAASVLIAETLPVDPARLEAIVTAILERIAQVLASPDFVAALTMRVVVEHGPWYPRPGASPGGLAVSQQAWTVMHDLVRDLRARCPVPVEVIARATWAHRVVPHTRGGITDSDVREHLPRLLDVASVALLTDAHQRDAAGAALGALLAPAPRAPREPRPKGPRKPRSQAGRPASRNDAFIAKRSAERDVAAKAKGCTRPPGTRGRCPRGCPYHDAQPKKRGWKQMCSKCGLPRAGLHCHDTPPAAQPPGPPAEPSDAAPALPSG